MDLKLSFHGGAGTVTGSRHLLTAGRRKVLFDCGMFQGLKQLRLLNWQRPAFDPRAVDAVVLTHTHIDHSGYIPRLVAEGFGGDVHCTAPTKQLAPILLLDAAKLQEEDAERANRKGYTRHRPALPLYDEGDARRAMRQFRSLRDDEWYDLGGGVRFRLHEAGHILGSAFAEVRVEKAGRERVIVFSGDIGQFSAPLHNDPAALPACDALVIESTYGNREHDPTPFIDQIRRPFAETLGRGGTVLIPAFAMARVQLVTVELRRLMESGDIPDVPVHIDSPMAVKITEIYRQYAGTGELDPAMTDEEWARLFPRDVRLHETPDESREINAMRGARIIISSSGMLTGGRVLHHLSRLLPGEDNLIALAGYQAPGTRGRALLEGAKTLRMHGQDIPVRARVLDVHGLSSHADANGLMRWLRSSPAVPPRIFVTHGEPDAAAAFAERIERELRVKPTVPALGDVCDLSAG